MNNILLPVLRIIVLFFVFFGIRTGNIHANEKVVMAHTRVTMHTTDHILRPNEEYTIAIRFQLDPGWHLYWKNPADSGLPPQVKWRLPKGVVMHPCKFPTPKTIPTPPLMAYGYEDELWLSYKFKTTSDFTPTDNMRADIEWLSCKEECIPGYGTLNLKKAAILTSEKIDAINDSRPQKLDPAFKIETKQDSDHFIIKVFYENISDLKNIYYFHKDYDVVIYNKPQLIKKYADRWDVHIPIQTQEIIKPNGILKLTDQDNSVTAFILDEFSISETTSALDTILLMFIYAFIGGLILNLMPCVFPVISLKALSLINNRSNLKADGLGYLAGVVTTFMVLAGLLIGLRAFGLQIGWGYQLQSPLFVTLIALLFLVLALNLFGLMEIGAGLTQLGGKGKKIKNKTLQSFFTGVLATVVATPCSAPFMGAAIGTALLVETYFTLFIFLGLAFGMAAPYTLICLYPKLIEYLPKPGAWMNTLKKVLGIMMLASTLWLIWVLDGVLDVFYLLPTIFGFLILIISIVLYGNNQRKFRSKLLPLFLAFVGISLSIATPLLYQQDQNNDWDAYDEDFVNNLLNSGKNVFIDFTARWCITCQMNKVTTLNKASTKELFEANNITFVQADWTSYDRAITRALAKYNRSSIPLYVLISHKDPNNPIILPEIITPEILHHHVNKLKGKEDA